MTEKKLNIKHFILALLITASWLTAFLVSYRTEGALLTYEGFAVDQEGRIYFGKESGRLHVYQNGEKIQTIQIPARGYAFTITDSNELVFQSGNDISFYSITDDPKELLSLERTIPVKDSTYKYSTTFQKQYGENKYFKAADGQTYRLSSSLSYTFISNEDGIVLQLRNNRLISLAFCGLGSILLLIFIIMVLRGHISLQKDSIFTRIIEQR